MSVIPAPATAVSSFDELGLSDSILRSLQSEGYARPTPIQAKAIPPVLAGRDVLGSAQTGTGKTAAFALPILQRLSQNKPQQGPRKIRTLVLSPTRELSAQIAESFRTYGKHLELKGTVIFGGVSQFRQEQAVKHGLDWVVATPGRLLDLVNQQIVDLRHVEVFVLDEADHMLDMGFIHDIRRIITKLPAVRQNLLFSATMPPEIRQLANSILRNPVNVEVARVSSTAEAVSQAVYFVEKRNKNTLLAHYLNNNPIARALVFTRTKHGADKVARHLNKEGIRAEAIHGNKNQNARVRAIASFKSDNPPVLVATDIAARGLDIDEVSHVVNYDVPNVPETYVHRIGRTGRAGATGEAISFCDREERSFLTAIEKLTKKKVAVRDDHPEYPAREPQQHAAAMPVAATPRGGHASHSHGSHSQASHRPAHHGPARQEHAPRRHEGHRSDQPRQGQGAPQRAQGAGGRRPAAVGGGVRPWSGHFGQQRKSGGKPQRRSGRSR